MTITVNRILVPIDFSPHAESEAAIQMEQEIERLQRKVQPASPKPDPAVALAARQVATQERDDVLENGGVAGVVQAMTAVIETEAVDAEAPGVAPNGLLLLEQRDGSPLGPGELIRSPDTCWPATQDHDVRFGHGAFSTLSVAQTPYLRRLRAP